jgi:hypothetical protein
MPYARQSGRNWLISNNLQQELDWVKRAMGITKQDFAIYANSFRLKELFLYLGWDNERTAIEYFTIGETLFKPRVIAHKNGFKIIECIVDTIPSYAIRTKASIMLKQLFYENLIILCNAARTEQVWLYRCNSNFKNTKNEARFFVGQDVEWLYQRANGMTFHLDEQDHITIVDVVARVSENFCVNNDKATIG